MRWCSGRVVWAWLCAVATVSALVPSSWRRGGQTVGELRATRSGMTFEEAIESRYSCKAFAEDRPVDDEVLRSVLEMTRRSPTSFNTQPYKLIVVRGLEAKAKLIAAMPDGNRPKVESAPLSVVFAADLKPSELLTDETPQFIKDALPIFVGQCSSAEAWAFKQAGIVAGNFLLACAAHGLQTCPMEGFASIDAVRTAVGLDPDRYSVALVVSVGYEADPRPKTSPRRDLAQLVCLNDASTPFV